MGKNLLCALSIHRFTEWKGGNDSSKCTQLRTCTRCNKREERLMGAGHWWSHWEYVADGSCEQVRICKRCGSEEQMSEPVHQFASWEPLVDKACVNVRMCNRCGYEERSEIPQAHQFGTWEYLAPNSCCQTRTCVICGVQQERVEHEEKVLVEEYSDTVSVAEYRVTVREYKCKRCSKTYIDHPGFPFDHDRYNVWV